MRLVSRVIDSAEYLLRALYSIAYSRPYNFSWFKEGVIAASGVPATRSSVNWLVKEGIRSVLSLTERVPPALNSSPLRVYHIPMANRMPAPSNKLVEAVRVIRREESAGNPILVHCLSGRGRTGMVLASYLVLVEGLEPEEAISIVRSARPGSLKRESQAQAVRALRRGYSGSSTS